MGEPTRKGGCPHDGRAATLGELIHEAVHRAVELAVEEELTAALGAARYGRDAARGGYRNGRRARTLTGPTGPLALTLPRAMLFAASGTREWTSTLVPRYQRRLREVNEAVVATYLAGGNTRRLRGALAPLLKAVPLSKSAVSRIVGTLKAEVEAWRTRSLADLDVFGLYLDAIALRVRSAGKVTSVPVLGVVAIRADGQKQLVALDLCGGESFDAWKGCLDDLVARGLGAPVVCVIDGHAGLRKAVGLVWPKRGSSAAPCTSFATLSARPPSTPWPRSARTSTGSSTPRPPRARERPTRPSRESGRHAAPAWCGAFMREARNCSRSSRFPRLSGRHSGPQT